MQWEPSRPSLCACFDTLVNFQDDLEACSKMVEENIVEHLMDSITTFDSDEQVCSTALYLLSIVTESDWGAQAFATSDNLAIVLNSLQYFSAKDFESVEDILRILMNAAAHVEVYLDDLDEDGNVLFVAEEGEEEEADDLNLGEEEEADSSRVRTTGSVEEHDVLTALPVAELSKPAEKTAKKTIRSRLSRLKSTVAKPPPPGGSGGGGGVSKNGKPKLKKQASSFASEKQGSGNVAVFGMAGVRWIQR